MIPTISDVRAAAARLAGHAVRTPLLNSPALDAAAGGHVWLKCENLQRTGSFKFRGAWNALVALGAEKRAGGIVAVSSGNHGQGVAEAARLLGAEATVVMPADAPRLKRQRTERSGARVVAYDRAREDRDTVVAALIAREGGTLVHPFDDPLVIAGQGTAGLEIAEDCAALGVVPATVIVPCGGGGLSAGVGLALRDAFPDVAITLVEPEAFDDYGRSLAAGEIVTNAATGGSVCDALMAGAPGALGFAINRANGVRAVTASDEEALAAVAFAFRELKLVVEPGGAVALAALLAGRVNLAGGVAVVVLSGGNIEAAVLQRALGDNG